MIRLICWFCITLMAAVLTAENLTGQVIFEDDFESYDVENPSDFSVNGVPSGNWTSNYTWMDATRIFDTSNFGGTRLWISYVDGTTLTSRAIDLEANSDYVFSAVLVSETYNGSRQLDATYDLLVGLDPAAAVSVIGGPQAVVTHGDNWQIDDSKEDHILFHEFSAGGINPDDKLFIEITRKGVHAGSNAWFGVDDVLVRKRETVEIQETGSTTTVSEDGVVDSLGIYVRDNPPSTVQVILSADDQVLVDGQTEATLVFNPPVDPNVPQVVIISAVDDNLEEALHSGQITFTTRSAAPEWNQYDVPQLAVSIQDNDWPFNYESEVFLGGLEGYPVYRIPGMIVAPDGSILTFCEGRPNYLDPGAAGYPIDLVMKRSIDGGESWSNLVLLEDDDDFDYSDPCPIQDDVTGMVILHYTRWPDDAGLFQVPAGWGPDSSNHFVLASTDNGQSWWGPYDITPQIKKQTWKGLVLGPGNGIQLRWQSDPARNGRLVAPAHIHGTKNFVTYSDDFGTTWESGGLAQNMTGGPNGNENEVVELTHGDLLLNARQSSGGNRRLFRSEDGGATWVEYYPSNFNITTCDGSMLRYSAGRDGGNRDRILFSGPLGDPAGSASGRWNIGVRTSYDEGRSFINPIQLKDGFGAYSVMSKLKDGTVGLLYESTTDHDISFLNFSIENLEGGFHPSPLIHYDGFGNRIDHSQGGMGWSGFWIGDALFTGETEALYDGASVPFKNYRFPMGKGRVDLVEGQAAQRLLATPIDLDSNAATYVSLLLSQALDGSPNDNFNESLIIALKDSGEETMVSFGVDSEECFMIQAPGNTIKTAPAALERSQAYLLVAKLVSRDGTAEGHYDQLFLKVFESGMDRIPLTDTTLVWTLEGTQSENHENLIDRISLEGDSHVTWSIDEVRIGSSFSAVAGGLLISPRKEK